MVVVIMSADGVASRKCLGFGDTLVVRHFGRGAGA